MFLVDGVIGQVRVDVLQILCVILLGGKPHQSFLINVYSQRIDRCNGDIDPQVPFVPVYQEWILDVLLDQAGRLACTSWHFVEGRNDLDSFALARGLRFHDPELVAIFAHLLLQELVLLRTIVARWHKIEVLVPIEGLHT